MKILIKIESFLLLPGLQVTGNDELQRWPCQSSHRITVSLDDLEPLTITLPYPILSDTIKATLNQESGTVDVVAAKALNDIWPEDVIRDQFRSNVENLEEYTNLKGITGHLESQYRKITFVRGALSVSDNFDDLLSKMRSTIAGIFRFAAKEKKMFIEVRSKGPSETKEWFIRAHLPIRTSSRGAPIILLSALDQSQVAHQTPQDQDKLKETLCDRDVSKQLYTLLLPREELQLFRSILRFNSTKIQPTTWQKKNLPQGGDSPYLATFIQPLYFDGFIPDPDVVGACRHCGKEGAQRRCGRCHTAPYCSAECQRADWPDHKSMCSK